MTPKIDVYAFGVILLELITGKDAIIVEEARARLLSSAIVSTMKGDHAEAELSFFMDPFSEGRKVEEIFVAAGSTKHSLPDARTRRETRHGGGDVSTSKNPVSFAEIRIITHGVHIGSSLCLNKYCENEF